MTKLNPVQESILALADEYMVFAADEDARVLIWKVDQDTQKMIQTMITFHNTDTALFPGLVLETLESFEAGIDFSQVLVSVLIKDHNESREDLEEPLKSWQPERALKGLKEGQSQLTPYLLSLFAKVKRQVKHVTLYMHPEPIQDPSGFAAWLRKEIEAEDDPAVRFMIFDDDEATLTQALQEPLGPKVMVRQPRADVNDIIEKTLVTTPKDPGPHADFQHHMVHAVTALRRQDLDSAFRQAKSAFGIAEKQGWPDMQITSLLVYGNAVLAKKEIDHVLTAARQAKAIGAKNEKHPSKPMLDNLLIQAHFLEANAFVVQSRWSEAAPAYDEAYKAAGKLKQTILQFEAIRMLTECHLRLKDNAEAWEKGKEAIEVARQLPDPIRKEGTFLHLVKALTPLAEERSQEKEEFATAMDDLIGEDWQEKVEACG